MILDEGYQLRVACSQVRQDARLTWRHVLLVYGRGRLNHGPKLALFAALRRVCGFFMFPDVLLLRLCRLRPDEIGAAVLWLASPVPGEDCAPDRSLGDAFRLCWAVLVRCFR